MREKREEGFSYGVLPGTSPPAVTADDIHITARCLEENPRFPQSSLRGMWRECEGQTTPTTLCDSPFSQQLKHRRERRGWRILFNRLNRRTTVVGPASISQQLNTLRKRGSWHILFNRCPGR